LPPEFFIDRSLGSEAVPAALRAVGAEVVTMRELWGEAEAQELLDTEWIARLRESNPIVLMKDDRIRYRPAEQLAFEQAGLRGFVLTNGNLRRAQMAAYFLDNLDTIRRIAEQPGPYICGVYRIRVERLWP
jgi:hypothetical protein